MKNQKGFSLVEGLLIVLIMSVIGFGGYYVWSQNNEDSEETDTSQTTEQENNNQDIQEPSEEVSTVPEGWVEYSSESQNFSLYRPSDWLVWDNCDGFDIGFVTASAKEYGPICNSGKPSQVRVGLSGIQPLYSNCEDAVKANSTSDNYKTNIECEVTNIANLPAIRIQSDSTEGGYYVAGTKLVDYSVITYEGTEYKLSYIQLPDWPDEMETFEKIADNFTVN